MRHSNGKRSRGRSGRRPSPQQNINRAYDSNGPAGKLRGTAAQLVEKYVSLARDARVGRDRVLVENFLQHAEHYQRIMNEIMIAQGIEPEAIDDDEQGGYDDQVDGNAGAGYEAGGNGGGYNAGPRQNGGQGSYNGGQRQNSGGQNSGGQNNAAQNGGGQSSGEQNNGGAPANVAPPAQPQAQPQPVISGAEEQPDIAADVAVEVPPVSLTPAPLPSAPRAIRGRRPRRQAAPREESQTAPETEGSDAE